MIERKSDKVAIVGFASSSRNLAPYGDPSWELWGLNSLYAIIPDTWSRWFEIHPREHFAKDLNRAELKQIGSDHYEWLRKLPGPGNRKYRPVYTQQHYAEIPASVAWPRDEINTWTRTRFGASAETDYFTSTPGEMMAMAVWMGFKEIALFGIDLCEDGEYAYQRPGLEYWIGIARGMGIKVHIPASAALCKASYVYGYTEPPSDFAAVEPLAVFFEEQNKRMEVEQTKLAQMINTLSGGRQAFEALKKMLEEPPYPNLSAVAVASNKFPTDLVRFASIPTPGQLALEKVERVLVFLNERILNLNQQVSLGMEGLKKLEGTREAFASSSVFTKHFGRGGKLEGQVDWHQKAPEKKEGAA